MPDQAELTRRRVVYVRDEDHDLWVEATDLAAALGQPLSVVVANALREYKPMVAWKARGGSE